MFSLSKYLVCDVFVLNVTYKICEHFKVLVTRMDVNARIRRKSRDSDGFRSENRTKRLCKSADFCIRYTTTD